MGATVRLEVALGLVPSRTIRSVSSPLHILRVTMDLRARRQTSVVLVGFGRALPSIIPPPGYLPESTAVRAAANNTDNQGNPDDPAFLWSRRKGPSASGAAGATTYRLSTETRLSRTPRSSALEPKE